VAKARRDGTRECLLRELGETGFRELLGKLQQTHRLYRHFETWGEVIGFMHGRSADDPLNDEILRPILEAHARDGDPRWRHVLMTIFWPGLVSVQRRLRKMERSGTDCAQDVDVMFLEVLLRLDLEKRSERFLQKILNETYHRLHTEYRRRHKRMGREIPTDPDVVIAMVGSYETDLDELLDRREQEEREIARYQELARHGVIPPRDVDLLIETRVRGLNVGEYARRTGKSYETLRKRRQRAEEAISRA
jgi:DNA-directed RNA polymerase specialized sigma24 family protein